MQMPETQLVNAVAGGNYTVNGAEVVFFSDLRLFANLETAEPSVSSTSDRVARN